MGSPVLFSTGAAPASSTTRPLVEFKAGKMEVRDKMVHPIRRQGLVFMRQSQDDNLMHFCWKDRQTGEVEDDLILFPDDCDFNRVKACTTGRVFCLNMRSSNRKLFFWMQEPKMDRDDELCKKVNELLNNPPRVSANDMGGSSDRDLQALFGNMSQEQVAQLLSSTGVNLASLLNSTSGRSPSSNSGASASSTASTTNSSAPTSANSGTATATTGGAASMATTATTGARDAQNLSDFRALMAGAMMDGSDEEANAILAATMASRGETSARIGSREANLPMLDLSTVINSDSLAHLMNDDEFLRLVEPHLPPISQSDEPEPLSSEERKKQFGDTVRSSQFRSSLSQFCVALQSGQLGPLMSQFGLNQACVDAANLGNLEAFVRALDDQSKSSSTAPNTGEQPPSEQRDKK